MVSLKMKYIHTQNPDQALHINGQHQGRNLLMIACFIYLLICYSSYYNNQREGSKYTHVLQQPPPGRGNTFTTLGIFLLFLSSPICLQNERSPKNRNLPKGILSTFFHIRPVGFFSSFNLKYFAHWHNINRMHMTQRPFKKIAKSFFRLELRLSDHTSHKTRVRAYNNPNHTDQLNTKLSTNDNIIYHYTIHSHK